MLFFAKTHVYFIFFEFFMLLFLIMGYQFWYKYVWKMIFTGFCDLKKIIFGKNYNLIGLELELQPGSRKTRTRTRANFGSTRTRTEVFFTTRTRTGL